jgi:chromosome segregation ATPase
MKKNHYLIILVLVLGVITIAVLNTRSNKKKEREIQEDVARIQSEIEPKLTKLMELKSNLKEQLVKLKEDTKVLTQEAKKEVKGQKEAIKGKVHELKEEARAKRDVLKQHADETKDEAIHKVIEKYNNTVKELEDLEAEMTSWKEEFAANLKTKKDKASKETHAKLEATRNKLREINDRIGKTIERAGQSMQHHD